MSNPSQPLAGKVAIVTGSGRGIGAAILLRLATLGANVVVNYANSADAAANIAAQAKTHGVSAITIKADVSKREEITSLFTQTITAFGRIDIVMSNSGIEHFDTLDRVTPADLDKVLAVNVKAQFYVAQEAYQHMERNGRLILISSLSAVQGYPRHAVYSLSKAAVQGMVRSLAWDFGPKGITVNCVAPGGIKTDMWTHAAADYIPGGDSMSVDEIDTRISATSPLGRPGMPDDIAGMVGFLASEEARWVTGQTLHVNGGCWMI